MQWVKRHTALILFIFVFAVGAVLSPHIGPAWDEPDNMFSAGVYVNFFTHGFDPSYFTNLTAKASVFGDSIVPNDYATSRYPPVPNFVATLFVYGGRLVGIPITAHTIIIAWHLATVLFLALAVAMTYRFGILLGLSLGSSLFAALAFFFYPQVFGHGLSNLKDTAQVSLAVTSLYYLVKKNFLLGAVVWGLGLATKFNAVYVPIIWGVWMVMTHKKFMIRSSLFIVLIGLTTTFLVWPYLWFEPVRHAGEVVRYFTTVGQGYRIAWDGMWYTVGAGRSLWWYPLASFLYTTPLLLLALFVFGLGMLIRRPCKKPVCIILPIWIVVPRLHQGALLSQQFGSFQRLSQTAPSWKLTPVSPALLRVTLCSHGDST